MNVLTNPLKRKYANFPNLVIVIGQLGICVCVFTFKIKMAIQNNILNLAEVNGGVKTMGHIQCI
jgi:hypothetical protein